VNIRSRVAASSRAKASYNLKLSAGSREASCRTDFTDKQRTRVGLTACAFSACTSAMPSPMRSPGYANPMTWRRPSASTLKSAIAPVSTRYTWDTGSPSAKRNPFASTPRKEALVGLWSRSQVVGAETATRLVNDDGSRLYRVSIGISHLPVAHEILPFACECPEGFLNLGGPCNSRDQGGAFRSAL